MSKTHLRCAASGSLLTQSTGHTLSPVPRDPVYGAMSHTPHIAPSPPPSPPHGAGPSPVLSIALPGRSSKLKPFHNIARSGSGDAPIAPGGARACDVSGVCSGHCVSIVRPYDRRIIFSCPIGGKSVPEASYVTTYHYGLLCTWQLDAGRTP